MIDSIPYAVAAVVAAFLAYRLAARWLERKFPVRLDPVEDVAALIHTVEKLQKEHETINARLAKMQSQISDASFAIGMKLSD